MLTAGTYEGLDPVGHAKDVGMPVIVGGSSGGHFSQVDSAEALCGRASWRGVISKIGLFETQEYTETGRAWGVKVGCP